MGLISALEVVPHRGFRFGDFLLDLDRAELIKNDEPVKLRPQSFDVLVYLVEHHGRLVEKRELIQAIWGDAEVTEDSLTHCIIDIRKVIGDRDRNVIHTVPRRGFVFDAPVERISATKTPLPAWRKEFVRGAALLVVAIAVVLLSLNEFRPATNSPLPAGREAQDHYAQARFLFNRRAAGDLATARDYYLQAIEFEPDFAAAWSGLAGTYSIEWGNGAFMDRGLLAQQKAAAERAVALDPGLAEGWVRLSGYYSAIGDPGAAARYLDRARAEQPDAPLVLSKLAGRYAFQGKLDRAIELQQQAVEREPLSFINRSNLSIFLFAAGRFKEALHENRRAHQIRPISVAQPDTLRGFAMIMLQRYDEALQLIDGWPEGPSKNAATAMANLKLGHDREAAVAFDLLVASTSADAYLRRAELLAFCEEFDNSFAVLDKLAESLPANAEIRLQQLALLDDIYLSPFLTALRTDRRWEPWLGGLRTNVVATL